jgi:hypothetical protein
MSYLEMARRVLEEQTRESENTTKKRINSPVCVECGVPIGPDEAECWWGLDRVHLACGKAAWQREWKGAAAHAASA